MELMKEHQLQDLQEMEELVVQVVEELAVKELLDQVLQQESLEQQTLAAAVVEEVMHQV